MPLLERTHPLVSGSTTSHRLVRAYQGERSAVVPVWFMRQAGRSLPEYRELRVGTRMLDACLDPELASEITLQPVRRHGVDAAIFFSDIVVPLLLAGVDVEIVPGKGPVFAKPIRTRADVDRLTECDPAQLGSDTFSAIEQAVRRCVAECPDTPLIGFAGAPFTLAAYLVEGGPSKDHLGARTLMHSDPEAWQQLMDWTADISGAFLRAQIQAGASAAQLFDSWAGSLSAVDYAARVAPASARALAHVREMTYEVVDPVSFALQTRRVPLVHFGVGTGDLLRAMYDAGADVIGVDYRIPLDEASRRLGGTVPVQGNIDPAFLAAGWPALSAHVRGVLERGRAAPAHVANLGHGVPPDTDPHVLTKLVEFIHEWQP